jgi:hypothetical protein
MIKLWSIPVINVAQELLLNWGMKMTKRKSQLPESYVRLKRYALLVEDICRDIELQGYGYDPGIVFSSPNGYHLDLPEWFLERLASYVQVGSNE